MRHTTLYAVLGLTLIAGIIGIGVEQQQTAQDLNTFGSADEFRDYLTAGEATTTGAMTGAVGDAGEFQESADRDAAAPTDGGDGGSEASDTRYSGTNVQVEGIDEPDIVKTDGQRLFFSRSSWNDRGNTSIIDARPPADMQVNGTIPAAGELFLDDGTLAVIGDDKLTAYDVSTDDRTRLWDHQFNGSLVSARQYDGQIYLVLRESINRGQPCPYTVMRTDRDIVVPCSSVHHPSEPMDADVTYTLLKLGQDGDVDATSSFIGTQSSSVVYMSQDGIYVTYPQQTPRSEVMMDFLEQHGQDLLDTDTYQRIQRLQDYEISQQAKLVEIQHLIQQYIEGLSEDEALQFDTELENRYGNFTEDRMREYTTTGIVRAGLDELEVTATGEVPGTPLNQFSLSEHDGDLRIATTVRAPDSWSVTANDMYVLDEDLDQIGSVLDMGLTEQIYSVRYVGDTAYVVTFRRIDPFHVLDLSDPSDPSLEGELKLPGYSSYLHPLGNDTVLGIGQEEGNVKAVLFDVSDPTSPSIQDEYRLDAGWSEIEQTHHAFLHDPRHGVFFLPAGDGGYIFSYEDGLTLEKAVSIQQAQRAVYIGDTLYVIGQDEIRALDETDWSVSGELSLPQISPDPYPIPRPIDTVR